METVALFSKSPHLLEILNQFLISRKLLCSCFDQSESFEKFLAETRAFPDLIVLDCESPDCVNNILSATNNFQNKINETHNQNGKKLNLKQIMTKNIYLLILVDKTKFKTFQSFQGNLEIFTLLKPFLYKDLESIYDQIVATSK